MTLKEAIADYMQTHSIGTKQVNIWGDLPFDKQNSIGIVVSPSPEPNKAIAVYRQSVDIWGKYTKAGDGLAKMQEVFDLFHKAVHYSMSGYHVYVSYASGMIDDMGRDPENNHLYKLTLVFAYRLE